MYQEPNFMTLCELKMRLGLAGETKEEREYWKNMQNTLIVSEIKNGYWFK